MKDLSTYLRAAGDLLMPRVCVVCGCTLGVHERHLCLACAADVPYTRYWRQVHNPLADRFNALLERHRGTEPMDYAYAVSLMYYKGDYRSIPRALKYHDNQAIGRFYGTLLGRHLASAPHFADIDLVIPVPLHWTRRRSRGYNQAAILALALTSALRAARAHTDALPDTHTNAPTDAFRDTRAYTDTHTDAPTTIRPAPSDARTHTDPLPDVLRDARVNTDTHTDTATTIRPAPSDAATTCRPAPSDTSPATRPIVPECRTDLLVRVRRTRTQTRVSVEQKAQNVASAFQVPERFSLGARFVARVNRLFSWAIRFVSQVIRLVSQVIQRVRPHGPGRLLSWLKDDPKQPALKTPASESPTSETPTLESPTLESPISELPIMETPILDSSTSESPIMETPILESSTSESPIMETPILESFTSESPIMETLILDSSTSESPIMETPILESSTSESPIMETPILESSTSESPIMESPTLESPIPDTPAMVLASARHILLVDDTFTTGATLYACYAALRPYTTARISIATLAAVEGTPSAVEGTPSTLGGGP